MHHEFRSFDVMKLTPRYEGPVVVIINDPPSDVLTPLVRQRRRLQAMLGGLTDEQWAHPSRCEAWTVRDVVAHLVSVTGFWNASIASGLAGEPTRWLVGFDPAATPPQLVQAMEELSSQEVLEQFDSASDAFVEALGGLKDQQWSVLAESPAGHVPIQLLAQHALWDSWIHERDIAIPLGSVSATEPDEVASCLKFAAVVSPVLSIGVGHAEFAGEVLAVDAVDPTVQFAIEVGESVRLDNGVPDGGAPCLRGEAVELTEALSLRRPLDPAAPVEWRQLLGGLETAFDAR